MADLSGVATTSSPLTWAKNVTDVSNQTMATATGIGSLLTDNSRLRVNGTLNANETAQIYSFTADDSGKSNTLLTGETTNSSTGLRVQLLGQGGRVLADSKSGMGAASTAYTSLQAGTYSLPKGSYYIKISRDGSIPASKAVSYVVEARMGGSYTNDYRTTEKAASTASTYNAASYASPVSSIISDSMASGGASGAVYSAADLFGVISSGESSQNTQTTPDTVLGDAANSASVAISNLQAAESS